MRRNENNPRSHRGSIEMAVRTSEARSLKIVDREAVLGSSLEFAFSISSTRDFVASQATSSLLRCNVVLVAPRAVGFLGSLGALQ